MASTSSIITGITTISAITLSDGWDIGDIVENFKEFGSWFQNLLPQNKVARIVCYSVGSILFVRLLPFILRKTSHLQYVEIQNRYFHRSTFHPELLRIKGNLLKELKDEGHNLPMVDDQLVLLEINVGGGTNLSYYPDGSKLMATDYWEMAKEHLEQNFPDEDDTPKIKLDRFIHTIPERLLSIPDSSVSAVICFHSLCSTTNVTLALLEIKRVLMQGGKVYFIEHVRAKKKYSSIWFSQLNFSPQMLLWDCSFKDLRKNIEQVAFSYVYCKEFNLDLSYQKCGFKCGPMQSLSPHIYGYAIK